MKLIGITGTIGCGKTTIANQLRDIGCLVLDIDGWVKRLYHRRWFLRIIKDNFSECFASGKFDKRELRNLVFNNKDKLKKLEDIIHPILNKELKKYVRKYAKYDKCVFIDTPLLFEMGWDKYCYKVILANVDYEIAKKRVMKRDNITADDFDKIYNKQIKNIDKEHMADIIINTDTTINLLRKNLIKIKDLL